MAVSDSLDTNLMLRLIMNDVPERREKVLNLLYTFPLYLEHPKLSFYDCCLACYAEIKHHEPLFTFDKKLAKQLPQAKALT